MKHWKWLVAGFLLVAVCGWLVIRSLQTPFVPPPLPADNGYADLLAAAELLAPRTSLFYEMDAEELAEIVAHNKPALMRAREALQKEIGVPIDWSRDPAQGGDPDLEVGIIALRAISRAFSADMRHQAANGNVSVAVDSGLATFRLGKECYRGGLIINSLIGFAIQGGAVKEFRRVVGQYPEAGEEIRQGLVPMLDTGELAEVVISREHQYIETATRGINRLELWINAQQIISSATKSTFQAELRITAQQRLFVVHLALQAYHNEHSNWPEALDQLAPEFFPAVPLDPYSQSPFVYRIEADAYRLYSVGQNKRDDGGTGDETGLNVDMLYDLTPVDQQE